MPQSSLSLSIVCWWQKNKNVCRNWFLVEVLCGPESANSEEIFAQVPAKFKTFFLSKQVDIIKKKNICPGTLEFPVTSRHQKKQHISH